MILNLPAGPGDTVFADFRESPKKKATYLDLTESFILRVELAQSDPDCLFTVVNYQKTDWRTFWMHEFGSMVFTKEQYLQMLDDSKK